MLFLDAPSHASRRRAWITRLGAACLALALVTATATTRAQEAQRLEYQVKAAFLYNFAKFVDWPPTAFPAPETPITIGILGDDPFGGWLDAMVRDKRIDRRRIVVKRLTRPAEATQCHLLFISNSEKTQLGLILAGLKRASVLTVTEVERGAAVAGIINFTTVGSKIRFEVNEPAATRAHLQISSKLLRLALNPITHT